MGMTHGYDRENPTDETQCIKVIRQAIDSGVTLIDTADVYGPFTNEDLVGRALTDGYRERAVLATKVGLVIPDDPTGLGKSTTAPGIYNQARPEHVRRAIDDSLRRLRTDYVDLYQLHRVDPLVPLEETWGAMAEAVQAGKVRFLGLSEVSVEQIKQADLIHPVSTVQSEMSLWTRDVMDAVLPYCEASGMALLPFAPLGRGFFAGRFTSRDELPSDDVRRRLPRFQQSAIEANLDLARRVKSVADRIGAAPGQVALAWVVAQGKRVVPIPGTKTPRYLAENARAAEVVLAPDDLAELDALPTAVGERY